MKKLSRPQLTQITLALLAGLILLTSATIIFNGLLNASKVNKSVERHGLIAKHISDSLDLQSYISESVLATNSIFKTGDLARERKKFDQSYQKFKSSKDPLQAELKATYEGAGGANLIMQMDSAQVIVDEMRNVALDVFDQFEKGNFTGARLLGEKISKHHMAATKTIREVVDTLQFRQKELLNSVAVYILSVRNFTILFFLVVMILSILVCLCGFNQLKNITKTINAQQMETKEALATSKSKNNFLSNLTHQVRTSLNTIIGFGEILRKTELTHSQRDYLRNVSNSADDLLSVVNDVLDLSKIESGSLIIESIPFRLDYVVQSIVDQVRIRSNNRDVEIKIQAATDIPMWFLGDPTRLRQIFLNLLTNAAKFTLKGSITIKVSGTLKEGQVGLKQPVRLVKIDVVDTGCGIPQHKLNNMLRALDNDTSSQGYGEAGIGISATKKIAEMMGGGLTGISESGKGSTFTVTLPLKESQSDQQNTPIPADMNQLKNQRVLIADSDTSTQSLVREFASDLGMQVLATFESAEDLLKNVDHYEDVNLVLLDLSSIHVNPKILIEDLGQKKSTVNAQFVAMCLNAVPGSAFRAESAGFDSFISKPLLRRDLIKVLLMTIGDKGNMHGRILTKHNFGEIQLTKMNIIVAEDNPVTQLLNLEIFKSLGCKFTQVSNGEELIEAIKTGKYDACVTDIDMPKLNGLEAAKKIRVDLKSKIPIIVVTAGVMNNELDRAMHSGINDIMAKPIHIDKLRAMLINFSIQIDPAPR